MSLNSFYPVICTDNPAASAEFYTKHFNFETTFEADWYVSLRSTLTPAFELSLLDYHHPSLPEPYQKPVQGLLLNLEVDNADREYRRLKAAGLSLALDIRSEAWGQRHFIVEGPDQVLIDVIEVIPPTGEFAETDTI